MVKISLSPKFLKDSFLIIMNKGLKEIFFGNKVKLDKKRLETLIWIKKNPKKFPKSGRKGNFVGVDVVHKGRGEVYLLSDGNYKGKSVLLFDENVKIKSGPDLYVYLSNYRDVRKDLGNFLNLGLLKGTIGGQAYYINKNIKDLSKYKSAVVYCKQFLELFTYAELK